jgi:hypothetical protein
MRSRSSFAIALMLAFFGSILPSTLINAQQVVTGPQFVLTKNLTRPQRGELKCPYFLWTKDGTPDQRISFNYTDDKGADQNDVPKVTNAAIVIDPARSVPIATMVGTDDYNHTLWQFSMSQETYVANKECLLGIPLTGAP